VVIKRLTINQNAILGYLVAKKGVNLVKRLDIYLNALENMGKLIRKF